MTGCAGAPTRIERTGWLAACAGDESGGMRVSLQNSPHSIGRPEAGAAKCDPRPLTGLEECDADLLRLPPNQPALPDRRVRNRKVK